VLETTRTRWTTAETRERELMLARVESKLPFHHLDSSIPLDKVISSGRRCPGSKLVLESCVSRHQDEAVVEEGKRGQATGERVEVIASSGSTLQWPGPSPAGSKDDTVVFHMSQTANTPSTAPVSLLLNSFSTPAPCP
jgi:hypothetical protein